MAVNYGVGHGPRSVFCADLDCDTDLDLSAAGSAGVTILKNNGDGTFQTKVDYDAGEQHYSVFCIDLDGDLDLDIATANSWSNNVSILRNLSIFTLGDVNANGKIDLADVIYLANYILKGGFSPVPLKSGDVNCDSKYDLVDVIKLARYVLFGEPFPC